jgi:hypothetical protein
MEVDPREWLRALRLIFQRRRWTLEMNPPIIFSVHSARDQIRQGEHKSKHQYRTSTFQRETTENGAYCEETSQESDLLDGRRPGRWMDALRRSGLPTTGLRTGGFACVADRAMALEPSRARPATASSAVHNTGRRPRLGPPSARPH